MYMYMLVGGDLNYEKYFTEFCYVHETTDVIVRKKITQVLKSTF